MQTHTSTHTCQDVSSVFPHFMIFFYFWTKILIWFYSETSFTSKILLICYQKKYVFFFSILFSVKTQKSEFSLVEQKCLYTYKPQTTPTKLDGCKETSHASNSRIKLLLLQSHRKLHRKKRCSQPIFERWAQAAAFVAVFILFIFFLPH